MGRTDETHWCGASKKGQKKKARPGGFEGGMPYHSGGDPINRQNERGLRGLAGEGGMVALSESGRGAHRSRALTGGGKRHNTGTTGPVQRGSQSAALRRGRSCTHTEKKRCRKMPRLTTLSRAGQEGDEGNNETTVQGVGLKNGGNSGWVGFWCAKWRRAPLRSAVAAADGGCLPAGWACARTWGGGRGVACRAASWQAGVS